jgi:chromosome segregation ATPase
VVFFSWAASCFWSWERKKVDGKQNVSNMEVIVVDKRKAYEEKLDAQLKEWNAQIALLKARAENAKADVKVDYYKTIEALENKQDKAKTKLQELKTAGDEAWEAVKTGAEKAWADVMTAYHDAVSKFK